MNFPTSPSDGDRYSTSGRTWEFDGQGWVLVDDPEEPGIVEEIDLSAPRTSPQDSDKLALVAENSLWSLLLGDLKSWLTSFFVSKSGDTMTGDLTFGGTGRRVLGDFSNSDISSRTLFRTRDSNATTAVGLVPSGSGEGSYMTFSNGADPNNSAYCYVGVNKSVFSLAAFKLGTGEYVPMVFNVGGINRLSIETDGRVRSVSGSIGYGVGAGSGVTQATSKSTNVTLNKPSGRIVTSAGTLAANTSVYFIFYSSYITRNSLFLVSVDATSVTNTLNYRVEITGVDTGLVAIRINNISASALSEALAINFAIIEGSAS